MPEINDMDEGHKHRADPYEEGGRYYPADHPYRADIQWDDGPETLVECDNCEWRGELFQLRPIKDCVLTPGHPSPIGRCPDCATLVYPPDKET